MMRYGGVLVYREVVGGYGGRSRMRGGCWHIWRVGAELVSQLGALLSRTLYVYSLWTYRTDTGPEVQGGERVVSVPILFVDFLLANLTDFF